MADATECTSALLATAAPSSGEKRLALAAIVASAGDGECVLVAEDVGHVIAMTAESLRDLGYSVLTAETAEEALDLLRQGSLTNGGSDLS